MTPKARGRRNAKPIKDTIPIANRISPAPASRPGGLSVPNGCRVHVRIVSGLSGPPNRPVTSGTVPTAMRRPATVRWGRVLPARLGACPGSSTKRFAGRGGGTTKGTKSTNVRTFGRIFLHWPFPASDGSSDLRETYGSAVDLRLASAVAFRLRRVRRVPVAARVSGLSDPTLFLFVFFVLFVVIIRKTGCRQRGLLLGRWAHDIFVGYAAFLVFVGLRM